MRRPNQDTLELAINSIAHMPHVRIHRDDFLRRELSGYCDPATVEAAVKHGIAYAKIETKIIEKIAKNSLNYEVNKASVISFVTGLPGGAAMLATIPADLMQNLVHLFRIAQKLAYLYGWKEFWPSGGEMDDETANLLICLVGIMFGVDEAAKLIKMRMAANVAEKAARKIAGERFAKEALSPIVKKTAQAIGVRMTEGSVVKNASKAVPLIGGLFSGLLTYGTLKPMALRLSKHFSEKTPADAQCDNILQIDYINVEFKEG